MLQFALNAAALMGTLIVPIWAIALTCIAGYIAFSDN